MPLLAPRSFAPASFSSLDDVMATCKPIACAVEREVSMTVRDAAPHELADGVANVVIVAAKPGKPCRTAAGPSGRAIRRVLGTGHAVLVLNRLFYGANPCVQNGCHDRGSYVHMHHVPSYANGETGKIAELIRRCTVHLRAVATSMRGLSPALPQEQVPAFLVPTQRAGTTSAQSVARAVHSRLPGGHLRFLNSLTIPCARRGSA
jgi:hypothetical protein